MLDLILYISSHLFIFYVKKLFKRQSLKKEWAEKALLRKLVKLGKGGAKCIQTVWCQGQRPILQRDIKNFMVSMHKNWVVFIKSMKKKKKRSQMKSFQSM